MMEGDESMQEEAFDRSTSRESTDYSRYGINQPKFTTTTTLGQAKTCNRLSTLEWAFLILTSLNILAVLGLTIERLVHVLVKDPESPDFTFIILLLINGLFCLFYTFHGVFRERQCELYALVGAIVIVGMYCLLEYFVFNRKGQTLIKLIRFVIFTIMAPFNSVLAYKVAKQFGYLAFFVVGASEHMQNLYSQASIFSCFLKFDLQTACSVVILVMKDGTEISTLEIYSLATGLTFSFAWTVFGWIVLWRELRYGAYVFAILGLIKPAYYMYKLVMQFLHLQDDSKATNNSVAYSLFAAVIIGMLVWLLLMIQLVTVTRNFGQGLRGRPLAINDENTILPEEEIARPPEYINVY